MKEKSLEAYNKVIEAMPYLNSYHLHKKAIKLGVRFSPNDLDIQQLTAYGIIEDTIEKYYSRMNKNGK